MLFDRRGESIEKKKFKLTSHDYWFCRVGGLRPESTSLRSRMALVRGHVTAVGSTVT